MIDKLFFGNFIRNLFLEKIKVFKNIVNVIENYEKFILFSKII